MYSTSGVLHPNEIVEFRIVYVHFYSNENNKFRGRLNGKFDTKVGDKTSKFIVPLVPDLYIKFFIEPFLKLVVFITAKA